MVFLVEIMGAAIWGRPGTNRPVNWRTFSLWEKSDGEGRRFCSQSLCDCEVSIDDESDQAS